MAKCTPIHAATIGLLAVGFALVALCLFQERQLDTPIGKVPDDLLIAVEKLINSIESFHGALGMEVSLNTVTPKRSSATPSGDQLSLVKEVLALKEAVQTLGMIRVDYLGDIRGGTPTRQVVAQARNGGSLRDIWADAENARREIMFMSYREVLERVGLPERVSGGNTVSWYYANGTSVFFTDGLATGIDY